jgi:hypothetical protein
MSLPALIAYFLSFMQKAAMVKSEALQNADVMKIGLDLKSLEHRKKHIEKTKGSGDFSAWGQIAGGLAGIGVMGVGSAVGGATGNGMFNGLSISSQGASSLGSVASQGFQLHANQLTSEAQEKEMWANYVAENAKAFEDSIQDPLMRSLDQHYSEMISTLEKLWQGQIQAIQSQANALS